MDDQARPLHRADQAGLVEAVWRRIDVRCDRSSGLGSNDAAAIRRVAAELGRACRETGFFYIRNHGVSTALMSAMFERSAAFFASTREEKEEFGIKKSPHNRGYVGIATESLNSAQADMKEAFNIGLDLSESIRGRRGQAVSRHKFMAVHTWISRGCAGLFQRVLAGRGRSASRDCRRSGTAA